MKASNVDILQKSAKEVSAIKVLLLGLASDHQVMKTSHENLDTALDFLAFHLTEVEKNLNSVIEQEDAAPKA